VRHAELELGSPVIPEFRCETGPDASETDVYLEHENMDQHKSCITSPSRAQADDATMKDNHIDLTLYDSDVHEDGGGVPGEAPSAGDLLGRGAVLHPGPVLTLWTGRRRRRRGGGRRRRGYGVQRRRHARSRFMERRDARSRFMERRGRARLQTATRKKCPQAEQKSARRGRTRRRGQRRPTR
jgi:hypothetical protein